MDGVVVLDRARLRLGSDHLFKGLFSQQQCMHMSLHLLGAAGVRAKEKKGGGDLCCCFLLHQSHALERSICILSSAFLCPDGIRRSPNPCNICLFEGDPSFFLMGTLILLSFGLGHRPKIILSAKIEVLV